MQWSPLQFVLSVPLCYCIVTILTIYVTINMKASTFTWAIQILCDSAQSEVAFCRMLVILFQ